MNSIRYQEPWDVGSHSSMCTFAMCEGYHDLESIATAITVLEMC